MDFETEIDDLKRRVIDLESAVNLLSGRIARVHPELQEVKRQNSQGFDRIGSALDRMVARLDTMNTQVWSLRDDLPAMIGDLMQRGGRAAGGGEVQ